jgi:hypothetical protein
VKKKILKKEIMPLEVEAVKALKSITNSIDDKNNRKIKTRFSNDAMWCFANDNSTRDFYARIEGTYNYGRFVKKIESSHNQEDSSSSWKVTFYCCYKYDYQEA